jgi:TetR/AcrR family transcriptional regulator, transcriptional repressor for nem operon
MGYSQADKAETHARIVALAAQRFREKGLDGLSIADLMKEAGLTHGGFYKHFASRDDLVAEAVAAALASAASRPTPEGKERGLAEFIKSYLGHAHRDSLGTGCAVSALMNDMSRAGAKAKTLYTGQVRRNVETFSQKLPSGTERERRAKAILTLSAMAGALGLARAVEDASLSDEILSVVSKALVKSLSD